MLSKLFCLLEHTNLLRCKCISQVSRKIGRPYCLLTVDFYCDVMYLCVVSTGRLTCLCRCFRLAALWNGNCTVSLNIWRHTSRVMNNARAQHKNRCKPACVLTFDPHTFQTAVQYYCRRERNELFGHVWIAQVTVQVYPISLCPMESLDLRLWPLSLYARIKTGAQSIAQ